MYMYICLYNTLKNIFSLIVNKQNKIKENIPPHLVRALTFSCLGSGWWSWCC